MIKPGAPHAMTQFVQIAYLVDDVREAALHHSRIFGSGPFFVRDYPALRANHRGREIRFQHAAAVGQWGTIQVELVENTGADPSVLSEYSHWSGKRHGIHHMAMFVDALDRTVASFKAAGHDEAMRVVLPFGEVVFVDALATHGHYIELYERLPELLAVKKRVADASIGFDGRNPVREATEDLRTLGLTTD